MAEQTSGIQPGESLLKPDRWVQDHGDYLYNYAYGRVQSKEIAEDLVQETFVAGLKAMHAFQGRSSEITWLISILKRKIIDYYRKAGSSKESPSSAFNDPFQKEGIHQGQWIMEQAPKEWKGDLDDPIHRTEFRNILEKCLSLLPDNLKAVFVLKYFEEMKSDQMCKELDCTPSNLWVMMHRAKLRLRDCIEIKWLK